MRGISAAVVLIGCVGDPGPEGPQGPEGSGNSTPPSLSAISPREVFPARTVDVVISGDDTSFDASTTVDFGAGITVQQVTLVSPTQLVARIELDETVALGPRDVRASTGDLVAMMGLAVVPSASVAIVAAGGPLYQGDFASFYARSVDNQLLSVGAEPVPADGMYLRGQLSQVFVDVNATPGPRQVIWRDIDYYFPKTYVSDAETLAVNARSPTPLALPSTTLITFDTRSKLYSMSTSTLGILTVARQNGGSFATNFAWLLLPSSGAFPAVDNGNSPLKHKLAAISAPGASTFYAVLAVGNTGNDAAHSVELVASHTPVAAITAETAAPHPLSSAQALSTPAIVSGTNAVANEQDAYSVTVPSGMRLEVTHEGTAPIEMGIWNPSSAFVGGNGEALTNGSCDVANSGASGTFKVVVYGGSVASYKIGFRVY